MSNSSHSPFLAVPFLEQSLTGVIGWRQNGALVAIDGVHFEEKFHLCRNLKTGWVTLSSGGDAPLPIQ